MLPYGFAFGSRQRSALLRGDCEKCLRDKRLDVLRALAVLLVLGRHVDMVAIWTKVGYAGVDLFFVLSGFLILGLLFTEFKKTGRRLDWRYVDEARKGDHICYISKSGKIPEPLSELENYPWIGHYFRRDYCGATRTVGADLTRLN